VKVPAALIKLNDEKRYKMKPKTSTCPICTQPTQEDFRPFCSKRCADIDLNRWLTDQYAIPIEEEPDDDAFQAPSQNPKEPKLN